MYSAKAFRLTTDEYNYLLPAMKHKLLQRCFASDENECSVIANGIDDVADILNRLKGLYDNYDELGNMIAYRCFVVGSFIPFRKSMGVIVYQILPS